MKGKHLVRLGIILLFGTAVFAACLQQPETIVETVVETVEVEGETIEVTRLVVETVVETVEIEVEEQEGH